jgi:hypothetical protein
MLLRKEIEAIKERWKITPERMEQLMRPPQESLENTNRYTFEIQNEFPGNERVLLCIDDKAWNEFTGPVAKGVIALLKEGK